MQQHLERLSGHEVRPGLTFEHVGHTLELSIELVNFCLLEATTWVAQAEWALRPVTPSAGDSRDGLPRGPPVVGS